jgi:hypothetical protein
MENETIQKIVEEISNNHHKIIDDWCKAYMAQIYCEGHGIKPGNYCLHEQDVYENGKFGKRYWFTKIEDENIPK